MNKTGSVRKYFFTLFDKVNDLQAEAYKANPELDIRGLDNPLEDLIEKLFKDYFSNVDNAEYSLSTIFADAQESIPSIVFIGLTGYCIISFDDDDVGREKIYIHAWKTLDKDFQAEFYGSAYVYSELHERLDYALHQIDFSDDFNDLDDITRLVRTKSYTEVAHDLRSKVGK